MNGSIVYLVTREHSYTLRCFLQDWAPILREKVQISFYDDELGSCPRGLSSNVIIFSDLDRLTAKKRSLAADLADKLMLSGKVVLNHPHRFVGRVELLKRLKSAGFNGFGAWRLPELRPSLRLRYPVFLRQDSGHEGSLSPLLHGPIDLAKAISRQLARALLGRVPLQDILVVEFENVSDPETGILSKYSYCKIGSLLVPRHVLFGKEWVLKYSKLYSNELELIEKDFIEKMPFYQEIERVFLLSGIDYGRIDFLIRPKDGAIQIWEINTNPSIIGHKTDIDPRRVNLQTHVMEGIAKAFLSLISA